MECRVAQLVMEITRRCNMRCKHCIRGEAQTLDMSLDTVDAVLDRVKAITSLTFTGGEPSLCWETMRYVLERVKNLHIPVQEVWLATNGKYVPEGFLAVCRDWNSYCMESCWGTDADRERMTQAQTAAFVHEMRLSNEVREGCYVALSVDQLHEPIPRENLYRLASLPHFVEDKIHRKEDDTSWVWKTGRAAENNIGEDFKSRWGFEPSDDEAKPIKVERISDNVVGIDSLYISADGTILKECNHSYSDMKKYKAQKVLLGWYDEGWLDRICEASMKMGRGTQ